MTPFNLEEYILFIPKLIWVNFVALNVSNV
jgi:hypothetical protein